MVTNSSIVAKVEGNHLVYTDVQIKMKIGDLDMSWESADGPNALSKDEKTDG